MSYFKNLKQEVLHILKTSEAARDCPVVCYGRLMNNRLGAEWKGLTAYEYLLRLSNKEIVAIESVSRYWRLIQKEYPLLRGKNYGQRLGLQNKVKEDLKP